jgi:hypothetical protein
VADQAAGGLRVHLWPRAPRLVALAVQLAQEPDAETLVVIKLSADCRCMERRGVLSNGKRGGLTVNT